MREHLHEHYDLYGEWTGVRSARKHIGWYVRGLPKAEAFRQHMNTLERSADQVEALTHYLDSLAEQGDRWPVASTPEVLESLA